MSDFKLLAIRPLIGCHEKYTKILSPGTLYPFLQDYIFYNADGLEALPDEEICGVCVPSSISTGIHNITSADGHPIEINISAIVGKNGSGKSTLMDLFFAAIYLTSVSEEILDESPRMVTEHISYVRDQIEKTKAIWEERMAQKGPGREEIYTVMIRLLETEKDLHKKIKDVKKMATELKVEVYYQVGDAVFCLRVYPEVGLPSTALFSLAKVDPDKALPLKKIGKTFLPSALAFSQNHFFYSIAINYSHYALNARHMGDWINSLFHKNDGYKTPLVLNPMRDDGNININREISLNKYRLLTNLLLQQKLSKKGQREVKVTDQLTVNMVVLQLDTKKVEEIKVKIGKNGLTGPKKEKGHMEDFFEVYFDDENFGDQLPAGNHLINLVLNYLLNKAEDIRKYDGLKHFQLDEKGRSEMNIHYFNALKAEPSHITFKINQAVNFLKRAALPKVPWPFPDYVQTSETDNFPPFELGLDQLLKWIGDVNAAELINFLPPSIFQIDFTLIDKKGFSSNFNDLSSGEQQLIYILQTVLYHINNLRSVRYSKLPRLHYPSINLIFDEIELYFHPAYQRAFISRLLESLEQIYVGRKRAIRSINILFLTHSPFFLSDIARDHITLLSIDKNSHRSTPSASKSQTFAANINELLVDSFFLDGTLMGEFAEQKVNGLITAIKADKPLSLNQKALLEMIGDSYLRNSLKYHLARKNDQN